MGFILDRFASLEAWVEVHIRPSGHSDPDGAKPAPDGAKLMPCAPDRLYANVVYGSLVPW